MRPWRSPTKLPASPGSCCGGAKVTTARGCLVHPHSPPKRSAGRRLRRAGRAGAARGVDGRIDRSEVRDTPWDPLAEERSLGCLELASRKPSWPAVHRPHQQAGHMDASDPVRPSKNSCGTGAVHIWVPAFAGTTRLHTSSVTVTGTWSDGRCQPRASRAIVKSLTPSFSARDTQM